MDDSALHLPYPHRLGYPATLLLAGVAMLGGLWAYNRYGASHA